MVNGPRRVVITGMGVVSPLGGAIEQVWDRLDQGVSGIVPMEMLPVDHLPTRVAGEARDFQGEIGDFGPLEKTLSRQIKKSLRMMCREIYMGTAAAQLALSGTGFYELGHNPDRVGVVFGCDYLLTNPDEYRAGILKCLDEAGEFHFEQWAEQGMPKVEPLWLLKYLPNMPASHIAIFNDLRGASNSLTLREASSNAAIAEAVTTLQRGRADIMLAGATGTRLHQLRTLHVLLQEQIAPGEDPPGESCRPFDLNRQGMVVGEGAGALVLETLESAQARGAEVFGEVLSSASSAAVDAQGVADYRTAIRNVLQKTIERAGLKPSDVGHVNAHGLGTSRCDQEEAQAIADVFGPQGVPVVAMKAFHGNLGAGSGVVEAIGSLLALRHGKLFGIPSYRTPDPECPVTVNQASGADPGASFINVNVTPQGQAAAVLVRRFDG